MIHTKIHHVFDSIDPVRYAHFGTAPHYILSPEIVEAMSIAEVNRTMGCLVKGRMLNLPHDRLVVERDDIAPGSVSSGRSFTHYERNDRTDCLAAWQVDLVKLFYQDNMVRGIPQELVLGLLDSATSPTGFEYVVFGPKGYNPPVHMLQHLAFPLSMMLVLTWVRGTSKEVISNAPHAALNKARIRKGKHPIPSYTLLRVHRVVTSKGERTTWHPDSKMRVHLRSGHYRWQPYGVGRSQVREQFIRPVWINLAPGAAPPVQSYTPAVVVP